MTLLETLWRETALHLWQTSLVLGVIAIVARPLRFAPARYQHTLWWIGFAALVLPVTLVRPLWQLVAPETAVTSPIVAYVSAAVRPSLVIEGATAVSSSGSIWIVVLTGVWALGAAWLCGRWVAASRRAGALLVCGLAGTSGPVRRKVLQAISGTDISPQRIYVGETRLVPAVTGLLHPRILLPQRVVDALDPEALRSVLLHEHWHCRRREPLLAALQRAILAVFFFYPPVWWLTRRLRDSAELVCDAAVLRAGIGAETYSRALARTLSLDLLPVSVAAVGVGRDSGLGQRLDRIDYPRRYRVMLKHRLAVAAAVIALAAVSYLPLRAISQTHGEAPEGPVLSEQTLPVGGVGAGSQAFATLSGTISATEGVLPGTTPLLVNVESEAGYRVVTEAAQETPEGCHDPTPQVASPPPDSPTLFTTLELCFPIQSNVPKLNVRTYLSYMEVHNHVSLPMQEKWTPFDETIEEMLSEDVQRLMDSGVLSDLSFEILDDPYPNGVAGKRVVLLIEDR